MLAIVLSIVLGQTDQKPPGLLSSDPTDRLAAVREIIKQPANEVRGGWLFESLSDSDPTVVLTSVKAWPEYQAMFTRELLDALDEGRLDGRPVQEPAPSLEEWDKRLAKRLVELGRGSSPEVAKEAQRALAILTGFERGLNDAVLLRVMRIGDPAKLTNGFVVGVRSLILEKPEVGRALLELEEPSVAMGVIFSMGFQMPAEMDGIYRTYIEKHVPDLQKAAMVGFSFRSTDVRRRQIAPFLRSGRSDIRLTAAEMCGYGDEDWKKIALDRNWPSAARTMAMEYRAVRSWDPEEVRRLHFDPDPYVQAAIASNNFPGLSDSPPDYELLIERSQSRVPELRAECLALLAQNPIMRAEALSRAFRDNSPVVRKLAAQISRNGEGFDAQRLQAYSDGLLPNAATIQIDFTLAQNQALLERSLRSPNDRTAAVAAWAVLPDRLRVAIPILIRCAKSGDENVQTLGFAGLDFIGNEGGFEAIASVASPASPRLFAIAVSWMKEGVKDKALPFLKRYVNHPDRKVRIAVKAKLVEFSKSDIDGGYRLLNGHL